ncbi:MAG: hypothetical protein M1823_005708 [Watsoniomyces obsoletus]|nr:MAG: hypothetical protein M1823_005708 [Watsoniomyces obsoletus]
MSEVLNPRPAGEVTAQPTPYPTPIKQAAGLVNDIHTDIMTLNFNDKIILTISQEGRLAQWVQVPLTGSSFNFAGLKFDQEGDNGDGDGLLPRSDLTASTILGGTIAERQTFGRLLATQLASAILTRNPEENRTLVVGLGLKNVNVNVNVDGDNNRRMFFDLIDLVLSCL